MTDSESVEVTGSPAFGIETMLDKIQLSQDYSIRRAFNGDSWLQVIPLGYYPLVAQAIISTFSQDEFKATERDLYKFIHELHYNIWMLLGPR